MSIKSVLGNPKFQQLLNTTITAVATYFGITVYQGSSAPAPDVDVEVHIPETSSTTQHPHPAVIQKNWNPVIQTECEKAVKMHVDASH